MRVSRLALVFLCESMLVACAAKPAPSLPVAAPAYPEFMYPAVPSISTTSDDAVGVDRGWRLLQSNDLRGADREFGVVLKKSPAFYPARAGSAYVALAGGQLDTALGSFDAALRTAPTYVPALVGRGQTLLALKRDTAAIEAFEAALAADPSLVELRRRVDLLRFRGLQDLIETARAAAAAGQLDEAVRAYDAALAASPDSAFLYRELGIVRRRQNNGDAALTQFRRASELDPTDAASLIDIGELLEARQDFAAAEAAYRKAMEIDPTADASARLAAVTERARDAALPAQFRAIATLPQITRGDLAALLAIRLNDVLRTVTPQEVVVTDVAGDWAAPWITEVARVGVMEPFANHTFQPRAPITRADLAGAVSRVITLLAVTEPELRPHLTARPAIADLPPSHLSYQAASVAVASGVMSLAAGGRFDVAQPVSGAEATAVVGRLRTLVAARR
jgi:tetratricopeptide (TPR) repeat protein